MLDFLAPGQMNRQAISSWVDLLMRRIVELLKYYIIFIHFQAAVSALLAVSVLYVEKNRKKILHNISKFQQFNTLANQLMMRYICQ